MKSIIVRICILCVCLLPIVSGKAICQKHVREIDQTIDDFVQAMNNFDGKAIKSFFVKDDFSKQIDQGHVIKYESYDSLKFEITQQNPHMPYFDVKDKKIRITDKNSGIVLCYLQSFHSSEDRDTWQYESICTIVLEKIKGRWLISTMHSSYITKNRNF